MERTRRDALRLAGSAAAALAAGCLAGPADTESPTDNGTPTPERPTEPPAARLPDRLARVDKPPYDIEATDCDYPDPERDPRYLCANMAAEPSLSFTQAATSGPVLDDEGLGVTGESGGNLYVTLLTDAADTARVDDGAGDPAQLVRETDFETHAALVVQTGWGSGSVLPHIKRVEATNTGVHAFGCHTDPCVQTSDVSARTAVVRFERPAELTGAVVSLTVAPDERWNVATGEGVVDIPSDD